jgi:hypothetical protein
MLNLADDERRRSAPKFSLLDSDNEDLLDLL